MEDSYHRHDINDEVWLLVEPHLPGQCGQWGGIAQDNRRAITAVFWDCEQECPGVIYLRITGSGTMSTRVHLVAQKRCLGKTVGTPDR